MDFIGLECIILTTWVGRRGRMLNSNTQNVKATPMALDLSSLPAMSKNSVEREGKREGLGGREFRNKGTRDNRNNLMVTGNGEMSKATHLDIAKCYFRPILTPVLPANPFHFRIIAPCIQSVVAVTISG